MYHLATSNHNANNELFEVYAPPECELTMTEPFPESVLLPPEPEPTMTEPGFVLLPFLHIRDFAACNSRIYATCLHYISVCRMEY